jgi:hypothetical protein
LADFAEGNGNVFLSLYLFHSHEALLNKKKLVRQDKGLSGGQGLSEAGLREGELSL